VKGIKRCRLPVAGWICHGDERDSMGDIVNGVVIVLCGDMTQVTLTVMSTE